jgi:hypothetical protein
MWDDRMFGIGKQANLFGSCFDMFPGMSQISPGLLPLFTGERGKNREKCGRNSGSVCHEGRAGIDGIKGLLGYGTWYWNAY